MGWDGMGWDGMGWDGMGWLAGVMWVHKVDSRAGALEGNAYGLVAPSACMFVKRKAGKKEKKTQAKERDGKHTKIFSG